jgi:ditrans,polycis-polyprenyl diphosphate synthase
LLNLTGQFHHELRRTTKMNSPLQASHLRKWLIQSPPAEWALSNVRELLMAAIRQGPVPQHVAFVMDGNRRFAKSHKIEVVEGHNLGFEALARVCCMALR